MSSIPKLLKARQFHSRIFAFFAVLILLFSKPSATHGEVFGQFMVWAGYSLVILGAFGRVFCSAFIGGKKNDEVVREGPFSVVRNPLYVFSFIAVVGIGMESRMITVLVLLAASYIIYYPKVVAKEEVFLKHKFGEPYEKFTAEVPRWIPAMKQYVEPETFECRPKFIRRTALDAAIFFLPLPCFIIISSLQHYGWLPVWLILP